jgi:hypothetical protein
VVYSGGLTGREAEAEWYIDVERMEDEAPSAAPEFGWAKRHAKNTRPHSSTLTAAASTCEHRTETTAARLIHCIVRVYT